MLHETFMCFLFRGTDKIHACGQFFFEWDIYGSGIKIGIALHQAAVCCKNVHLPAFCRRLVKCEVYKD